MNLNPNITFRVADIRSQSELVLNAGSNRQIEIGDEFIVYSADNEKMIIDPESGIALGYLEVYRGTGRVISVQETMCIIEAISIGSDKRVKLFTSSNGEPIFFNPSYGDFAKPNATKIKSVK